MNIEPGIYDNRTTFRREVWARLRDGSVELVEFATAEMFLQKDMLHGTSHAPWGHYPDLPKTTT